MAEGKIALTVSRGAPRITGGNRSRDRVFAESETLTRTTVRDPSDAQSDAQSDAPSDAPSGDPIDGSVTVLAASGTIAQPGRPLPCPSRRTSAAHWSR